MQGAMVILIALSGLGCQNRAVDAGNPPAPPSPIVSSEVDPFPSNAIPPPYPSYYPVGDPNSADITRQGALRKTLWSFFLGRDPEVRTPREIEAEIFGYGNGR